MGAGCTGDDGKTWRQPWAWQGYSNTGWLEPLPMGQELGQVWAHSSQAGLTAPGLGSWHPGWAHSSRAGLMAPGLCSWHPGWAHGMQRWSLATLPLGYSSSYLSLKIKNLLKRGRRHSHDVSSFARQDWAASRLRLTLQ